MGDEEKSASPALTPFLPLRGLIAFPHEEYPIFIGRRMSINAIGAAESQHLPILLVAQRDPNLPKPSADDMHSVGVLGSVGEVMRLPDGTIKALIAGKRRARVRNFSFAAPYFSATTEEIDEPSVPAGSLDALVRKVRSTFEFYMRGKSRVPQEAVTSIMQIEDAGVLADKIAGHLLITLTDKQALLELLDPPQRLQRILEHMNATPGAAASSA